MRCTICDSEFNVGEDILVTQAAKVTIRRDVSGLTTIFDEEVGPRTVHHRCLLAEALPAVEDELYNEVLQRIRENGDCPMCSPFVPK